ncbi:MAG TPA: DNA polymerase/3'-5' exonuclease PolX [Syntrophomonadaceae bacterium]|nr:DNA polymerase/3'-5' exonuclease PolX [Syntrophomonadaceae bacterium]
MTNREAAAVLDRIADILQLKDENPFKIKAYRKAAGSIYHLDEDINSLNQKHRLGDIPGVGQGVKSILEELLNTGQCVYYEELLEDYPPGVFDMLAIPGIGHTTVRLIYDHLGVTNLNELLQAATDKKIRLLPGLGPKTEYNIKKGIELLQHNTGKFTLGTALPMAEQFRDFLSNFNGIEQAAITGSIRRWKPLVSDIDLLVVALDFDYIRSKIIDYQEIKSITLEEKDHIKGILSYNIPFEIIMVNPEDFYERLVWTTGSKAHRGALANDLGFDPEIHIPAGSETDIYQSMNLPWIPPELRENTGEIQTAINGRMPELLEVSDLKGDLHVHSDWSDGTRKIAELAYYAQKSGYSYLAVTDHSKSLPISGGLNSERLSAQARVIDELNATLKNFRILKGIEADILRDGTLDFDDNILDKLDIVVASIHSNFKLNRDEQTARILKAIENKNVNIIGHLTGRLLNRRSGYEVDLDRILKAAALNKVALEINSHPDRLDIDEDTVRKACGAGVKIAINSDAHDLNEFANLRYGISVARRGWAQKKDIINTMDINEILRYLNRLD